MHNDYWNWNFRSFPSGQPYSQHSGGSFDPCDDEDDCAAGSGSGLGPPSIETSNGDDSSYEPSVTINEDNEEYSHPGNADSGKCMLLRTFEL